VNIAPYIAVLRNTEHRNFEQAVIASVDALDALVIYLADFIDEVEDEEQRVALGKQRDHCVALRDDLKEWGLGIPNHSVSK
jgi:hypothetical protein